MPTRRHLVAITLLASLLAAPFSAARAQDATAFVVNLGNGLVAAVNGPGSTAEKQRRIVTLIEDAVDIDGIARFSLGRFWRTATPEQQKAYVELFRQVLRNNIGSKLGEFQGVRFKPTSTTVKEGDTLVGTIIERPNQQPNNVQWVVNQIGGKPKVIDVIAEGTSLRVTQRSDYAAYLTRNNNSVDALISAMKQQVAN